MYDDDDDFWDRPYDYLDDDSGELDFSDDTINITDDVNYDDNDHFYLHETDDEELFLADLTEIDELDAAFVLGFVDTMNDETYEAETHLKRAARYKDQPGEPIPLSDRLSTEKSLAGEFLDEFKRRHNKDGSLKNN